MKLHRLIRSGAEREADRPDYLMPYREDGDGVHVELEHHHLHKMDVADPPEVGTEVEFHGRGHVTHVRSEDTEDGVRHHVRVHLTHGGMEHNSSRESERQKLRGDLEKATADSGKVQMAAARR